MNKIKRLLNSMLLCSLVVGTASSLEGVNCWDTSVTGSLTYSACTSDQKTCVPPSPVGNICNPCAAQVPPTVAICETCKSQSGTYMHDYGCSTYYNCSQTSTTNPQKDCPPCGGYTLATALWNSPSCAAFNPSSPSACASTTAPTQTSQCDACSLGTNVSNSQFCTQYRTCKGSGTANAAVDCPMCQTKYPGSSLLSSNDCKKLTCTSTATTPNATVCGYCSGVTGTTSAITTYCANYKTCLNTINLSTADCTMCHTQFPGSGADTSQTCKTTVTNTCSPNPYIPPTTHAQCDFCKNVPSSKIYQDPYCTSYYRCATTYTATPSVDCDFCKKNHPNLALYTSPICKTYYTCSKTTNITTADCDTCSWSSGSNVYISSVCQNYYHPGCPSPHQTKKMCILSDLPSSLLNQTSSMNVTLTFAPGGPNLLSGQFSDGRGNYYQRTLDLCACPSCSVTNNGGTITCP